MEEVKLDLSKWDDPHDKANVEMTFILNRALPFDRKKYNRICGVIKDTPKGLVFYNLLTMLAGFKNIPVYVDRSSRKVRFWNKKNKSVKRVFFNRKFKKLSLEEDTLYLTDNNMFIENIRPFMGFSDERIENIARLLYGWED